MYLPLLFWLKPLTRCADDRISQLGLVLSVRFVQPIVYNRYVDGLDTWQPHADALYRERGKKNRTRRIGQREP